MSSETQSTTTQMSETVETFLRGFGLIGMMILFAAFITLMVCSYWHVDALLREPKAPSVLKLLPRTVMRLYLYSLSYMFGFLVIYASILVCLSMQDSLNKHHNLFSNDSAYIDHRHNTRDIPTGLL